MKDILIRYRDDRLQEPIVFARKHFVTMQS